jgi:hypothetical protein
MENGAALLCAWEKNMLGPLVVRLPLPYSRDGGLSCGSLLWLS